MAYGFLAWVRVPFAEPLGGLGLILWLESRGRYGWDDGYCDALKHQAERRAAAALEEGR